MKKTPLLNYISKITFLSIAICIIVLLLLRVVPREYINNVPSYIMMFYLVTTLGYCFLYYNKKKAKMRFEQAYMLTKTIKFLIYIAVLAIVLLCNIEKNVKFAVAYLLLFVFYQIFDTVTILQLSKESDNKKEKK